MLWNRLGKTQVIERKKFVDVLRIESKNDGRCNPELLVPHKRTWMQRKLNINRTECKKNLMKRITNLENEKNNDEYELIMGLFWSGSKSIGDWNDKRDSDDEGEEMSEKKTRGRNDVNDVSKEMRMEKMTGNQNEVGKKWGNKRWGERNNETRGGVYVERGRNDEVKEMRMGKMTGEQN